MYMNRSSLLLAVLLSGLIASTSMAQTVQPTFGVGAGSFFAEEGETFDPSALYGSIHWYAVSLPFGTESSTGIGVELGFSGEAAGAGSAVAYTIWSLNRTEIVAGRIYGGSDMKIGESVGGKFRSDFDLRFVVGTFLGKIGPGNLAMELYAAEENRPISFAFIYRFGG